MDCKVIESSTQYASVLFPDPETLLGVLQKVYSGEGLYIYIDEVCLNCLVEDCQPVLTYKITYGREGSPDKQRTIEVSPAGDMDFFLGQIYAAIDQRGELI